MATARETAYRITRRVNGEGAYLSLLLRYGMDPGSVDARERALVTELAYGVQRHRGRMDFIIAAFSRRPPAELDPAVLDMLRLGMYQLTEMRIPQHAAVNETVSLAGQLLGRGAASYVNAVMRSACRMVMDSSEAKRLPPFVTRATACQSAICGCQSGKAGGSAPKASRCRWSRR
jgi:16S rRNA (cytosine967-C5)-methyltransferase